MDTCTTNITPTTQPQQQLPLDLDHESCLKQQLLRHAVQEEVDTFMEKPELVYNSLYLDFICTQMREFPLLNCHPKAKDKLEELILNLPHFLTVSQRASKHDQQNKKLRVFVAGTFHLNFRTPLERQKDRAALRNERTIEQETEDVDPTNRVRKANFVKAEHELAKAAESLFLELTQEDGVPKMFKLFKDTPNICDLPPVYQQFMRKFGKMLALNVEKNFAAEEQVTKLKKLYRITPMKAIRGVLAVTNPVKILQGFVSLFLARPLGVHNLLQKMAATSTDVKRTEAQLTKARLNTITLFKRFGPKVGHDLIEHIEKYLETHELPAPDAENYAENENGYREVSYESLYNVDFLIEIIKEKIDVTQVQPVELHSIHQVLLNEIRVKEKRDLINMLGTEQVVSIIKELWTVFDEPIALLCQANLGKHLDHMLKCAKAIVKVSEASRKHDVDARLEAYDAVVQRFQEVLYAFLHDVALCDSGAFQQTLQWYMNIVKCISGDPIDVQALLRDLPESERSEVIAEVNETIEYQAKVHEGGKSVQRPRDAALRRLIPAFSALVRNRLPSKATAASRSEISPVSEVVGASLPIA